MTNLKVINFIKWALTHAKSVPTGAAMPLPIDACCADPWHYLFGSVRVQTTPVTLARYRQAYINRGWAGADFDAAVAGWRSTDHATDCQGLLDAYLTYVCDDETDINADTNYRLWCNTKGLIDDITRDYVIGEAVFVSNKNGKMTHVGWICGFDSDGTPLVVEARGLRYGVVVTRLDTRPWTHRGIMAKKFKYSEEIEMEKIKFEVASPMHTGAAYKAMQTALSAAGYTDGDGKTLMEDGKWGTKSQTAFTAMIADYSTHSPAGADPITADDAATVLMHGIRITITKDGANQ